MNRRLISAILMLIMLFAFVPKAAMAAPAILYLGADGKPHYVTASEVNEVISASHSVTWNSASGWYVVSNTNVTITGEITVGTNTNLILADGAALNITGKIAGSGNSSLTIYAQSQNVSTMGGLSVHKESGRAVDFTGSLTICGGNITATNSGENICIYTAAGSMKVFGGNVNIHSASTGSSAHGIRGDNGIEISGGSVTVNTAGAYSHGIYAGSGNIEISGNAEVSISTTGQSASGINANLGSVTVFGSAIASVTTTNTAAYGVSGNSGVTLSGNAAVNISTIGQNANGINANDAGASVTVSGSATANVSTAGADACGIFNRGSTAISGGTMNIVSGSHGIRSEGNVTLSGSATANVTTTNAYAYGIYGGLGITIEGGNVEAFAPNAKALYSGSVSIEPKSFTVLAGESKALCSTWSEALPALTTYKYVKITQLTVAYIDENNVPRSHPATRLSNTDADWSKACYVASGDIEIPSSVMLATNTSLIIADNASLTANSIINCNNFNLKIYAQSTGSDMGTLIASSSGSAPAIAVNNGSITIVGGRISATSTGDDGVGIYSDGNIAILGGNILVNASGNNSTGILSNNGDIEFSGGVIEVYSLNAAALGVSNTNAVSFAGAYAAPQSRTVMAGDAAPGEAWVEGASRPLTTYGYIKIFPAAPVPPAPTHGGTHIYWWSSLETQPESTPTLPDVDTLSTPEPLVAAEPPAAANVPPQTGDRGSALGVIMIAAAAWVMAVAGSSKRKEHR